MIKCENCIQYLFCDKRSVDKYFCECYVQKRCNSCAKYPFCKISNSPKDTCENYKVKKIF